MLQEDSNGEASFEIIDKKASELSMAESLSSVSSPYSIPSPSLITSPGGNLLSNVPPPTSLPDFTLWPTQGSSASTMPPRAAPTMVQSPPQGAATTKPMQTTFKHTSSVPSIPPITQPIPTSQQLPLFTGTQPFAPPPQFPPPTQQVTSQSQQFSASQQFPHTQFSAAIPPSKGVQHGAVSVPLQEPSQGYTGGTTTAGGGGGFIGWMKDAVSSGGILHKVAEKAKSSVDTIITTLDPQMTEYIYSGGDLEVTLASQSEEEIHMVREVFYTVFGKAWINGINVNVPPKEGIAIGLDQGILWAEEKLSSALTQRRIPTIAIQDTLLQHGQNNFFQLSVIILKDTERNVSLQTFSQCTPIPLDAFIKKAEKEVPDYGKYSSRDKLLSVYLQNCKLEWQELITGVSRREILFLALKSLVQMYKNHLDLKQ